jgi:DNA helicase-4
MDIFSKFFKKSKDTVAPSSNVVMNDECRKLIELKSLLDKFTAGNHYVARSEYIKQFEEQRKVIEYFGVLENSGMLGNFCAQNGLRAEFVSDILSKYVHITDIVDKANDDYIDRAMQAEQTYLDNILHDVDPKIMLDEDQRRVVLTDEDYCLVVAGAGAGKTTTVAAKVKYLVEKNKVKPEQILVVSFTNKAVKELKDKLHDDLQIACPVATFHSTGNAILHKHNPEKLNIVEESKLYYIVMDYFKDSIIKNESMVNNLIRFFASYFDAPYEGNDLNAFFNKIAKSNFTTMRSDLENFKEEVMETRTKKMITIQSEMLRSYQEVEIANFLYLNNIDYQYEPIYPYNILRAKKPYTPDFVITQGDKTTYIEHFGITEDGKNNRYSESELEFYKQAIREKIELHKKHATTLIYTYSEYIDHRSITEHLQEKLETCGFELKPRPQKEIMEKLVSSEESRYVRKLVTLICNFISNFKVNGFNEDEFNRMYHSTQNVRTRLFLDICNDCYLHYQRCLKKNDAVDFQDMINESARLLREVKELGQKLDFRYIIVDEYQDISRQRFDLVSALSDVTEAKIIAVGDDWQSIYAFSGSDITLFTKFKEKMGYARLLKIENTYRNSQEVIDIAGTFIQKNDSQIKKTLRSPKHIDKPVIIYTYDPALKGEKTNWRSGVNYAIAAATEHALDQIVAFNKSENQGSKKILVLGRFGFDGDQLDKSGLFEYEKRGDKLKSVKYPKMDITFMTAHSSKGLGYDEVIVVNGKNETYGFPSKIEDDPVLALVIKEDRSIDYAEERRLFYVAMTRTKNRVYFIAPEKNPSEFLLELKSFFKNIELVGQWNEEPPQQIGKKNCPICGYPMQFKFHRSYGLRLYICTNEPELCGFMTNEIKAGKLSIMKCEECRNGYLVIKPGKDDGYFLGCTNYNKSGTGCSRVIAKKYYYEMMKYAPDPEVSKEEKLIAAQKSEQKPAKGADESKVKINFQTPEETRDTGDVSIENQQAEQPGIQVSDSFLTPKMIGVLYRNHDLSEILTTVLKAMVHVNEVRFYGVFTLNEVLHGSTSDKVMKAGLNNVAEYGKLAWLPINETTTIINWLIDNHYIHQTTGQYPVLHPTSDTALFNEKITREQLNKIKNMLEG